MSGKQIKLFLVDGTPGGLTTAEITNWTGHVLSARRSDLAELLRRDEMQRTGVYLLLGDDDAAVGETRCYIGEADVVADRLRHHQRDKDFWDRLVAITSKDTNLTKSHGRYLESRLIALATQAGRVSLENGTAPPVPALPEADASDMDYFIAQLQIVLPVLGVNAIRVRPAAAGPVAAGSSPVTSPIFRLQHAKLNVDATAQQIDGEFTMFSGSTVVPSWDAVGKAESTIRAYASYRAQHQRLVADGAIVTDNGVGRVTRDIVFSSPSGAGAVALGRSCNGRLEWVGPNGLTFGAWESRGVDQPPDPGINSRSSALD
ncbi:MAG TPA: GIY-YIG nuclease family protein [Mycobacteriales bacterium]|nr:GIY-YIG nuclease family protein [Mycobacteriales bacterium]